MSKQKVKAREMIHWKENTDRTLGDEKRRKRRKRERKKERKRKKKKLVEGLLHSDVVAIMAPVRCPMAPAYPGIAGGTFCEVLVHG